MSAINLIDRKDVAAFCEKLRKQDKKIVFTNGCFDILHLGHVRYLAQARALGDFLFLGLNSDASVSKLKGPERPIQNETDRAEILLHLKSIDAVSIFNEPTPLELIMQVKPHVLVKGGDWTPDKIVGREFVESHGGIVKSLPFVKGHSTTGLVEKIQKL
jgi:rfaE bifunctional protein nucleotidyltransferase chain/domain